MPKWMSADSSLFSCTLRHGRSHYVFTGNFLSMTTTAVFNVIILGNTNVCHPSHQHLMTQRKLSETPTSYHTNGRSVPTTSPCMRSDSKIHISKTNFSDAQLTYCPYCLCAPWMRPNDVQTFPPEFRGVQGQPLAFHSLQHRRRTTPNEVAVKKRKTKDYFICVCTNIRWCSI